MLKTSTLARFPKININEMYAFIVKLKKTGTFFNRLKCSPEAYIALKDFFLTEEEEERLRVGMVEDNKKRRDPKTISEVMPEYSEWGHVLGAEIVIDPTQPAGEMEFE